MDDGMPLAIVSMKQACENTALAVCLDVAIGPGGRGAVVGREQRILRRMAADHLCQIASGNIAIVTGSDLGPLCFPIFRIALEICASE
ncbi:hypothetical protein ACVWXQ_009624 [Bradyrhizobium sp. S3.14.4]